MDFRFEIEPAPMSFTGESNGKRGTLFSKQSLTRLWRTRWRMKTWIWTAKTA